MSTKVSRAGITWRDFAIPASRLAIPWDVCQEVLVYENFFPDRPADYKAQIAAELTELGTAVPPAVEMGYHLCYGSPADEHLVMPRDTAKEAAKPAPSKDAAPAKPSAPTAATSGPGR